VRTVDPAIHPKPWKAASGTEHFEPKGILIYSWTRFLRPKYPASVLQIFAIASYYVRFAP
jgi:hypothetical protein